MKIVLALRKQDNHVAQVAVKSMPFTIGRHDECQLRIKSKTVSRKHCVITFDEDEKHVLIKDLGSRNGTIVNDVRLKRGESSRLFDGDELKIGKARFQLSIRDELTDLPKLPDVELTDDPSDEVTHETTLFAPEMLDDHRRIDGGQKSEVAGKTQKEASESTAAQAEDRNAKAKDGDEPPQKKENAEVKAGPKRLPPNLRPKGPADSQQAANEALRRMLSSD